MDAGYAGAGLTAGGSSYESSSYSSSNETNYGASSGDAAFTAADANRDGVLSRGEFQAAGY